MEQPPLSTFHFAERPRAGFRGPGALCVRLILNSHRKIEKWSEQKLRQTRRRTQAGLTPGKDDNEVWHHFCRSRLKVSMGVQYYAFNAVQTPWLFLM